MRKKNKWQKCKIIKAQWKKMRMKFLKISVILFSSEAKLMKISRKLDLGQLRANL